MNLHDYYSIYRICGSGQDSWFMLAFKGRDMLARRTESECRREADAHYKERKLRNFANMDLEQGCTLGWLSVPHWTGARK